MRVEEITPLVLTRDEEANVGRCLERLAWARRIVVVDSFSTDRTLELIRQTPQAEVFQRAFDDHAAQWNFGLEQVASEWVLSLDADYVLTDALARELASLEPPLEVLAYAAPFKYCVLGRPLRGGVYPPRLVLFRRDGLRYRMDGHTQRLDVPASRTGRLRSPLLHDDRKPLGHWSRNQFRYSSLEAAKLLSAPPGSLSFADRLRRSTFLAPFLVLPYCLLVQRGILDGWPGLYYAFQRSLAELLLTLVLLDRRIRQRGAPGDNLDKRPEGV
jgi:glycosyltransferase involved in cell wall biosynthesis